MDVIDRVGEFFNGFTELAERGMRRLFGSSNEREVRGIGFIREKDGKSRVLPASTLDKINQLEPQLQKLSDAELKETALKIRARLKQGQALDDVLPEVFAAVREAGRRFLQMRHYDVQMVGGCILHSGKIAEMVTGEGKTLVATLPAALNAMAGHVHVVTVNDYLALRDMEWMGPLYLGLGLTVGAIQANMEPDQKAKAYDCDITYGTSNEFGFDYLRDNMKTARRGDDRFSVWRQQVQGPLVFAIVDEIDNILIDEARTPLIISGAAHDDIGKYKEADRIARQLTRDVHFEVKEKEHSCHMTEEGVRRAETLAGVESFYTAGNMEWPHLIDNSLKAYHLYKRDVNYVVENGEVVIVDEHTGRKMPGRQWSDGLHQAVEAKEGVEIKKVSQTLATVTLQNFFKLYKKLCGMTGTAMTEANEFYKIYNLDVVAVPTNRPMKRINHQDVVFRSEREKWTAVVDEVVEVHKTGRPILVGTVSIEKSEKLKAMLDKRGVRSQLLNAKHHEREAEIIAQAGRLNAVTISTNMAGRGTDIILGGNPENMAWEQLKTKYASRLDVPKSEWDRLSAEIAEREGMKTEGRKVAEAGGLHVVGTERHDSRRIDLQLRGRSGRQGDPGSSRFFLSLEDDLMRIFAGERVKAMLTWLGMQEGEAIEHSMVTKQIEKAQKGVEERHFDMRKNVLEYDEVMDHQRKEVYGYRQRILDGANCRDLIIDMMDRQVDKQARQFLASSYPWETAAAFSSGTLGIQTDWQDIREMPYEQLVDHLKDDAQRQSELLVEEQLDENLPAGADPRDWSWQALANWANRHFGLNTSDRELRKLARGNLPEGEFDREALSRHLLDRAQESIKRLDFTPLQVILADDFGRKQLSGWLRHHFGVELAPTEFEKFEDVDPAIQLAQSKVHDFYREKEIRFPVLVGMNRYAGAQQPDKSGLIAWTNQRFAAHLSEESFKEKERSQLANILLDCSRTFFPDQEDITELEAKLGELRQGAGPQAQTLYAAAVDYLNHTFGTRLTVDLNEDPLPGGVLAQRILQAFDLRYRPELSDAERYVLLDRLDHAWKEHLYFMDHLRQGIGLVGYAQKDPKVEYKREGMRTFEQMWTRISEEVTGIIFRLETQSSPEFLNNLWANASASHAQAQSVYQQAEQAQQANAVNNGGDVPAIQPIRNFDKKVGRNDPCPCGSGKKYKKCHGGGA